jgi:hypothetical protein
MAASLAGWVEQFFLDDPWRPWWWLYDEHGFWLDRGDAAALTLYGFQFALGAGFLVVGFGLIRKSQRQKPLG